jgi:hypothetical protein
MTNKWFSNETGDYFKVGDHVIWHGDPSETVGILVLIDEETFGVQWEDGYKEYSAEHQDAIKKY